MQKRCFVCGNEGDSCLCENCKNNIDIEALCNKIIAYRPLIVDNPDTDPLWDEIARPIVYPNRFQDLAQEVADYLPSPRREYQKIHSMVGEQSSVSKAYKAAFIEEYNKCVDKEGLTREENNRLKGLMLSTLYYDYRYFEANELAEQIADIEELPWQAISALADFFIKTRRYDVAESILTRAKENANGEKSEIDRYLKLEEDCQKYREKAEAGKKEYIPNPHEDKEKAVNSYIEFMASLGIDVQKPVKVPKPIATDAYPTPTFLEKPDFNSFVAYDFETTGLSSTQDCIIEVGAVKVVNGKIVEKDEFIFSEFVKPFKKSLSNDVSKLTGITAEDLKGARPMWEVIPDFMNFVGDNVLVGYNNATFDSKFLSRAGRYSNIIIKNPQFDVLKYVRQMKKCGDLVAENTKLGTVCELFGIENPAAHRAWADALVTAKLYLKLNQ